MTRIHNKEVNKISECNLLHAIINPLRRTKKINIHYYPILHGCMNNIKCKARFNKFRILLESYFSSTIVMVRIIEKLNPEKDDVIQLYTQTGNITTNHKFKLDFILPPLIATNVVT